MVLKFLGKIESYLPRQYKEIATHFSYVFALRIAQQLIGFVSFFFIVNHVPKEIIGHYHFVLSVIALISITSLPGMRGALLQSMARGQGGFFKVATRYSVWGSCIGGLILLTVAAYYYVKQDFIMAGAFGIAAVLNPAGYGLLSWKSSYAGEERFKMLSIMDTSRTLILSILFMLSVLFYTSSHIVLLSIALIVPAIQNFILYGIEYQKHKNAPEAEEGMREYGFKTSAYQIFSVLAQEVDRLCIYNFISAGELAVYNVAMKIPEAAKSVIQDLGDVVVPKFARMPSYTKRLDHILKIVSLFLFLGIIVFAFTIFPIIFEWLVPEDYYDSMVYAQVLLCTVAIGNHALLRSKYIKSQKNIESYKKLIIMSTGIKIFTVPILVFLFHIWGAVIAIFIQRVFISIYVEIIIRKHHT